MTDHPITMTDPEAALWTELDDLRRRLAEAERERDEARAMMLEAIERQKRAEADCDAARATASTESEDADAMREVRAALAGAGFAVKDDETEGDAVARLAGARDEHATDARYLREIIADLREEHKAETDARNAVLAATSTVLLDAAAQIRAYLAEGRIEEVRVLLSLLTGGIARPEVTRG